MKGKKGKEGDPSQTTMKRPELKRAFEKAKLFEIRRLVRRIRQLESKKGTEEQLKKNQRKVTRLEQQLEFAKDARLEMLNQYIQDQSSRENEIPVKQSESTEYDAQSMVLEKLLKSVDVEKLTVKPDSETQKETGDLVISCSENSSKDISESSKETIPNDDEVGNTEIKQKQKERKFVSSSRGESEGLSDSEMEQDALEDETNKKKRSGKRKRKTSEDSMEGAISLSAGSMFVGSMKRKGDSAVAKQSKKKKKDEKNRLGQHARQKMWEKLYGKKAKHRIKAAKEEGKGKQIRKESKPYKQQDVKTKALHPSWEASQAKKKKESIVEFTGQKITFDD